VAIAADNGPKRFEHYLFPLFPALQRLLYMMISDGA
jgi:hypothetical protein